MVDENKVRLMTKLAIYEKNESNRSLVMSKYYKNDYVRYNVLKTLVASTIVYWCVVGSYVFMEFDTILAKINEIDYFEIMYSLLGGYVAFCLLYFVFATFLYNYRYNKAKKGLIEYNVNLKDLIKADDGEAYAGKVVENSELELAMEDSAAKSESTYSSIQNNSKSTVSHSKILKQRMQQQEKVKEQQIIENVKRRNERLAAQNEAKLRQQEKLESERRRIQERRKQLERQQLDKLRNERMHRMSQTRDNHEYRGNSDIKDMGRSDR